MWFDALIVCTLAFAVIRGAMKGIVWQLAVIASLVFCFAFAGTLSLAVAPHIGVKPPLNRWIAMFIIYAVFSFVAFGVARLVRDWIEAVRFVDYDRHLGAVLGFVKGTIFCLVLTFFSVTLSDDLRSEVMESQSGRLAAIVMDRLHPVMPDELHDVLEPYIHQLDQPGLDLKHSHHDHADDDDHDHAHHDDADDPFTDPTEPAVSAGSGGDLASWLGKLPPMLDGDLRSLVRRAFERTDPRDRQELLDKLRSAVPSLMRTIAGEWQNGKPAGHEAEARQRQRMLNEMADAFGLDSETRDILFFEVDRALAGVPDQVATAVIEDWHSDVLRLERDVDPATDSRTRLDDRIVRQLAQAGVPLQALGSALQARLRDSQLR